MSTMRPDASAPGLERAPEPERGADTVATTDDAFLGGALNLLQPVSGYRAGIDAILLAAAVRDGRADRPLRVLDLGSGVGAAGLAVARRLERAAVTLVEREAPLAGLAVANAERNGLDGRVSVVHGDFTRASRSPAAQRDDAAAASEDGGHLQDAPLGLPTAAFERVIANPPFHTDGRGTPAPVALKARAHAMGAGLLEDWARAMARYTAPSGIVTVIHKTEGLQELLAALDGRFGGLAVLPLHPRMGAPAIRVIVEGTKGSKAPLRLLSGRVLHGEGDAFNGWARDVLANGAALNLDAGA